MLEQDCGNSRRRVPTGMPAWLLTLPPTWLDDAAQDDAAPPPCVSARHPAHAPASTGPEEAGSGGKLDVGGASAIADGHPLHRVYLASPDTSSSCHSLDNTLVAKRGLLGRIAAPASPRPVVLPSHKVCDLVQSDWQPPKLEPVCTSASGTSLGADVQLAQQDFGGEVLLSICDILTFGFDPEAQGLCNFEKANSSTQSPAHQVRDIDRSVYNDNEICELLSSGGNNLELPNGDNNKKRNRV